MTTDLVLAAIDQAIFARERDGVKELTGLIHHNDAGSQYTSVQHRRGLLLQRRHHVRLVDVSVAGGQEPSAFGIDDPVERNVLGHHEFAHRTPPNCMAVRL